MLQANNNKIVVKTKIIVNVKTCPINDTPDPKQVKREILVTLKLCLLFFAIHKKNCVL